MSAPTGIWLLPNDAAKHLGIPFTNESQFRKKYDLDESKYFERGYGPITESKLETTGKFETFRMSGRS